MPRARGRYVALALVVMASMTFLDLDAINRLLFGASQSLNIHDEVLQQIRGLQDLNSTLVTENLEVPDSKPTRDEYMKVVEQQLQKLREEQVHFNSTIVTGYFELSDSKHTHEEYMNWAKNLLCVDDPLVVFTHWEFVDEFLQLRSNATNRTVVVPIEFEDIELGDTLHYPDEFWTSLENWWPKSTWQRLKDEPGLYKNTRLYKVWLAKTWFVNQAIQMNPFNSSLYSWIDIGYMRHGADFCGHVVMNHTELVPDDGRVMLFMNRDITKKDLRGLTHRVNYGPPYLIGGWISAYVDAWPQYMRKMEESIKLYRRRGKNLMNDQAVMQTTCMSNPGLCAVTRVGKFKGFFGVKKLFRDGGDICTWDPGLGVPLKKGEPGFCLQ